MVEIAPDDFEMIVADAMDGIPKRYSLHMNNVGFVIEDFPTQEQMEQLHLYRGQTLYGLYEGVPLTQRGGNYSGVLPDKITIFRIPILALSRDREEVVETVKNTVWHEVAHHFGLGHGRIAELEGKKPKN